MDPGQPVLWGPVPGGIALHLCRLCVAVGAFKPQLEHADDRLRPGAQHFLEQVPGDCGPEFCDAGALFCPVSGGWVLFRLPVPGAAGCDPLVPVRMDWLPPGCGDAALFRHAHPELCGAGGDRVCLQRRRVLIGCKGLVGLFPQRLGDCRDGRCQPGGVGTSGYGDFLRDVRRIYSAVLRPVPSCPQKGRCQKLTTSGRDADARRLSRLRRSLQKETARNLLATPYGEGSTEASQSLYKSEKGRNPTFPHDIRKTAAKNTEGPSPGNSRGWVLAVY